MGIDVHVFKFLRYANVKSPFGSVVTIGRQGVHIPQDVLNQLTHCVPEIASGDFCENLLVKVFGATGVESIDNSAYEGATIIHDMNQPLPRGLHRKYNTVIDGGCLEHIFDVRQALGNCSDLCAVGGQIIHILPADNFCGHGFFQFSPELFTSLYSEENGYINTEVFLADLSNLSEWYVARRRGRGQRFEISSSGPVYALVRTTLATDAPVVRAQQSDYEWLWGQDQNPENPIECYPSTDLECPPSKGKGFLSVLKAQFFRLRPPKEIKPAAKISAKGFVLESRSIDSM